MEANFKRIADMTVAQHYQWGDQCDGWHFVKTNELSVIREAMPPGTTEQMHYHKRARQFFYLLSGTATFNIDGKIFSVNAGQGINILPGEKHRISNQTEAEITFLVVSVPKSHGDRVNVG